ncbi:hypothetical protein FACS189459_5380 [Bacilli bacterium]|nr:hypothetical protein FACS189459_5380 [Bacilli bacterium]GHU53577.1 hypothetical protein FACS189496_5050 [Bacilli bacterium]
MNLIAGICGIIFGVIGGIIIGLIIGSRVTTKQYKKQLDENPPISEQQIRMMYTQMGRKPSETQVKQVMNSFKKNAKK